MRQLLGKMAGKIRNWCDLRRAIRSRPGANRVFANISRHTRSTVNGNVLCEALWDQPYHWLRVAMFRNALAEVYGCGLVGVFQEDASVEVRASLRSLPLTGEEVLPVSAGASYLQQAKGMLRGIERADQLLDLEFPRGIHAYCFYDGVLKIQRLGSVDCHDDNLAQHLGLLLQYLDFYESLLDRRDIRAIVVSHPVHLRYATLAWSALQRDIPVFVINYANESITIRKLSSCADFSLPVEYPTITQRDSLSFAMRARLVNIGRDYHQRMRSRKIGQVSMVNTYLGAEERYRMRGQMEKIIGVDCRKPNAVILCPCWPDFPHSYGRSYYTDYENWFDLTLKSIKDIKDCNWILKPHPAEHLYGDKVTLKKLINGRLATGIFLWPEGASGTALEQFADYLVTCIGSSGIEYPAIGKPVIAASQTPYSSWRFCHSTFEREEYLNALRHITCLDPPSLQQQEDANIFLALTYTCPPEITNGQYIYPWGLLSYRLWTGLPDFVGRNQENINHEMRMMRRWLESGTHSYNVYKGLNPDLWGN